MKRFILVLIGVAFAVFSFALDNLRAVTMVSYEQSWSDDEGTLALRNNTEETIKDVAFQIIYLDMQGNQLDYKDFYRKVEIAPGMARKVDIPAYEHDRSYNYYKSEALYGHRSFKIKFKLLDYNLPQEEASQHEETNEVGVSRDKPDGGSFFWGLFPLIFMLLALGACIGIFVLVANMARQRNRSAILWLIFSLFATPVLAIILLLCLGRADDRRLY